MGQLVTPKQTRQCSFSTQPGGTGKTSGRNESERVWRRNIKPDGDRWESPEWGGRVGCETTKTATAADSWGYEAVVAPGV